jgi:hypothetical protein
MTHHPPLPLVIVARIAAESAVSEKADELADRALTLILITSWAVRTGRVLRPVPVSELSPDELVEFWADDQLWAESNMPIA